ncbi:GAF domain-containing protein [candidate division KSB1 bacterium]|nr:GAF domain-containing protein [candidate division KSB1 bacterium]
MLQKIATIRDESLSLNEILDLVLTTIVTELQFKFGAVVLYKQRSRRLTHYINTSFPRELIKSLESIRFEEIQAIHRMAHNNVLLCSESAGCKRSAFNFTLLGEESDAGINSNLMLFFEVNQEFAGIMYFMSDESKFLTEKQFCELGKISQILGAEIEYAWEEVQLETRKIPRAEEFRDRTRAIRFPNLAIHPRAALKKTLLELLHKLRLNGGSIHLINEQAGCAELKAHAGLPLRFIEHIENLSIHDPTVSAIRNAGNALITIELISQGRKGWQILKECGIQRMVSVPLRSMNKIIGFFNFSVPKFRTFKTEEMYLFDAISKQLGALLSNNSIKKPITKFSTNTQANALSNSAH